MVLELGDYICSSTQYDLEDIIRKLRKPNVDWTEKFVKTVSPLLVGKRAWAFDDSYSYKITDVMVCEKGYACIGEDGKRLVRVSGLLVDFFEN